MAPSEPEMAGPEADSGGGVAPTAGAGAEAGGIDLELLELRTSSAGEERRSGEGAGCLAAEVFSPGRFGPLAFDLLNGWNLDDLEQAEEARWEIADRRPWLLVASPKCTAFSVMQALTGGPTTETLEEGR